MKQKKVLPSAPALVDPSDICNALVGLKGIRVLHYQRRGPLAEIAIEQVVSGVTCPTCLSPAQVKDRSVVTYVDLPFGGTQMRIKWKKHRMHCVTEHCPKGTWTLTDHREGSPIADPLSL
ncbi:MAG: transposase family protein [Acidimicrobiales bacterium]